MKYYFYKRQQRRGNVTHFESFKLLYGNPKITKGKEKNLWEISGDKPFALGVIEGSYNVNSFLEYRRYILDGMTGERECIKKKHIAPMKKEELKIALTDIWSNHFNPNFIKRESTHMAMQYLVSYFVGFHSVVFDLDDHDRYMRTIGIYGDPKLMESCVIVSHDKIKQLYILRLEPFQFHGVIEHVYDYDGRVRVLREVRISSTRIFETQRPQVIRFSHDREFLQYQLIPETDIVQKLSSHEILETMNPVWIGPFPDRTNLEVLTAAKRNEWLNKDAQWEVITSDRDTGTPILESFQNLDEKVFSCYMHIDSLSGIRIDARIHYDAGIRNVDYSIELSVTMDQANSAYHIHHEIIELLSKKNKDFLLDIGRFHFQDEQFDDPDDPIKVRTFDVAKFMELMEQVNPSNILNRIHDQLKNEAEKIVSMTDQRAKNEALGNFLSIFVKSYMDFSLFSVVQQEFEQVVHFTHRNYPFDTTVTGKELNIQPPLIPTHEVDGMLHMTMIEFGQSISIRFHHNGRIVLRNRSKIGGSTICTESMYCDLVFNHTIGSRSIFIYACKYSGIRFVQQDLLRFRSADQAYRFMKCLPDLVDVEVKTVADQELLRVCCGGQTTQVYHLTFLRSVIQKYGCQYYTEFPHSSYAEPVGKNLGLELDEYITIYNFNEQEIH